MSYQLVNMKQNTAIVILISLILLVIITVLLFVFTPSELDPNEAALQDFIKRQEDTHNRVIMTNALAYKDPDMCEQLKTRQLRRDCYDQFE